MKPTTIRLLWINVVSHLFFASSNAVVLPVSTTGSIVFQYSPVTWVENLALTSKGDILPITTTSSILSQLNPATGHIQELYDFHEAGNAIQSISSVSPDVFAVCVLTCNISLLSCTPGSASVWLVDLQDHMVLPHWNGNSSVKVSKITALSEAIMVNGMSGLVGGQSVIIADSGLGGIWQVDLAARIASLAFVDESMMPTASIPTGINGIRVRGGHLYFSNSARGTLNRVVIDPRTGRMKGEVELITSGLIGPDDFEIDDLQNIAYICNGAANQSLLQPLKGGKSEVVTNLPGPTSVRWVNTGRSDHRNDQELYASTVGGLSQYVLHNVTTGGAIYKVSISAD